MDDLLPGTEVVARGLRWEVVFQQSLGSQTLCRLRGLDGVVQGREMDLLSPFEKIEPLQQELQPEKGGPLRNWLVYHQAFLLDQALGQDALLAVQPGRLRMEPYQLVPVLRALKMSRVRLMLADGVGLGKTIQAGLVLTELIARRLAHRILITSPAGPLLDQWKTEMCERFGLRFDVIDRTRFEEIRRSRELGSNPFDHVPLGLASIDFLKQESILDQLDRCSYDVVIIDEAHHCAESSGLSDREDSQRRRLAQVLARRCDGLLLLTATPHDGNDRSFASLCELLDPSLVDGRGSLRGDRYRRHVIRRLKKHIKDPVTKEPLFKDRIVLPCPVVADHEAHSAFIQFHKELLALIAPELRRAFRARSYTDVLSFISLLKRSVSTVEACRSTLIVVSERLRQVLAGKAETLEGRRQRLRILREMHRRVEKFGAMSVAEEEEKQLLEAEDLAQQLADMEREVRAGTRQVAKSVTIVSALDELVELGERALPQDAKLTYLLGQVLDIRKQEPNANVLIYTEYESSLRAAASFLEEANLGTILTLSGQDDERRRGVVTRTFCSHDGILLVSTDTSAEGLNLHQHCHNLIHLELPFNPNRLEQRNGRIDRYGQTRDPVVRYLFLRGTFEERILLRLIAKYERQRARLTFVPNTLGLTTASDLVNEKLLAGLIEEDAQLFRRDEGPLFDFAGDAPEEGSDQATHELLEEIDRSLKGFEHATKLHTWLGDAGLNAEDRLLAEADQARTAATGAGVVDLAQFVTDAVLLDGGELSPDSDGPVFGLFLPPNWCSGLDGTAGYDPSTRELLLTKDLEVNADSADRPVGFLGRAHPVVRRALDRVRHHSLGATVRSGQDLRVSAVATTDKEATLLFTFLGRVISHAGREFERVIAVKVARSGVAEFYSSPPDWLSLVDSHKALRTSDLWKKHFANWGSAAKSMAMQAATHGFIPLAETFVRGHRDLLQEERSRQLEWLQHRVDEITQDLAPTQVQGSLFDENSLPAGSVPTSWSTLSDPEARLSALSADPAQRAALRHEADGVVRIHRQRMNVIERHLDTAKRDVIPLGLLMLVPEALRAT